MKAILALALFAVGMTLPAFAEDAATDETATVQEDANTPAQPEEEKTPAE